jgi:hypothetical protein
LEELMDSNIVVTQFTSAAIFVWAMQKLKTAPWFPWLKNEGQIWLKRGASIVAAIGTHTGISHVWAPGTEVGAGVLTISIPSLAIIAVTLWHWLGQFTIQEAMYQSVSKNSPTPAPEVPTAKVDVIPPKG